MWGGMWMTGAILIIDLFRIHQRKQREKWQTNDSVWRRRMTHNRWLESICWRSHKSTASTQSSKRWLGDQSTWWWCSLVPSVRKHLREKKRKKTAHKHRTQNDVSFSTLSRLRNRRAIYMAAHLPFDTTITVIRRHIFTDLTIFFCSIVLDRVFLLVCATLFIYLALKRTRLD